MIDQRKIIKNTVILYLRMLFSFFLSIYSTRIILNNIGVEDYGIYNIIVGVTGLLVVFNSAMATSTQRFLSYSKGKHDNNELKSIFSTSLIIHYAIGIIILMLLFFGGDFFVDNFLSIPKDRITTAKIILKIISGYTFFMIITSPFDGTLVANENFFTLAISEITLSIVVFLGAVIVSFEMQDKLLVYTVVVMIGSTMIAIFKQIYCSIKYTECNLIPNTFNILFFKEIAAFAGWNLFASLSSIAQGQGLVLLINNFFGVRMNAAYGLANDIKAKLSTVTSVGIKAIYPQLVKSEGSGNRVEMVKLSNFTTIIPFCLGVFFGVPLIVEIDFVLDLWLKVIPENATTLVVFMIIYYLISTLSFGVNTAVLSIGKIKYYQIISSFIIILNLPVIYTLFKFNYGFEWIVIVPLIFEFVLYVFRIIYLKKIMSNISINSIISTALKLVLLLVLSLFCAYGLREIFDSGIFRVGIVVLVNALITTFFIIYIILDKNEKQFFYNVLKSSISRILK